MQLQSKYGRQWGKMQSDGIAVGTSVGTYNQSQSQSQPYYSLKQYGINDKYSAMRQSTNKDRDRQLRDASNYSNWEPVNDKNRQTNNYRERDNYREREPTTSYKQHSSSITHLKRNEAVINRIQHNAMQKHTEDTHHMRDMQSKQSASPYDRWERERGGRENGRRQNEGRLNENGRRLNENVVNSLHRTPTDMTPEKVRKESNPRGSEERKRQLIEKSLNLREKLMKLSSTSLNVSRVNINANALNSNASNVNALNSNPVQSQSSARPARGGSGFDDDNNERYRRYPKQQLFSAINIKDSSPSFVKQQQYQSSNPASKYIPIDRFQAKRDLSSIISMRDSGESSGLRTINELNNKINQRLQSILNNYTRK